MLAPEDVQQIVAALQPSIQTMIDGALAAGKAEPTGDIPPVAPAHDDMADHYAKMCEYAAAGDEKSINDMCGGMDDEGKKKMRAHIETNEPDEGKRGNLLKYMAEPAPYAKGKTESDAAKYQRERDDYRAKYQKEMNTRKTAEARNSELEERVSAIEKDRRHAVRYQKLKELEAEGYSFNPEAEIDEVMDLDDGKFDRHVDRIQAHYQRIPLGNISLPSIKPSPYVREDKSAQYAKVAGQRCRAKQAQGEKVDFDAEFALARSEDEAKSGAPLAGK